MSSSRMLRVAVAQYAVDRAISIDNLRAKLDRWIEQAANGGAKLVVFPEFAGMEIAASADRRMVADRRSPTRHKLGPLPVATLTRREGPCLDWETAAVQAALPDYMDIHTELAAKHDVYILAGSLPIVGKRDTIRNRAYFFTPSKTFGFQDKIVPTRWERDVWGITGGDQIRTMDTRFGPIGIAICYDVEFPHVARLQAEAGARIILTPCCCDSLRGYHRVRIGARARALENQAYVLQSPTIGDATWSATIGTAIGRAGIFAPPDLGPLENGVIAQGDFETPQWTFADLDLAAIDRIRQGDGVIANAGEWKSHLRFCQAAKGSIEPVTIRSDARMSTNARKVLLVGKQ